VNWNYPINYTDLDLTIDCFIVAVTFDPTISVDPLTSHHDYSNPRQSGAEQPSGHNHVIAKSRDVTKTKTPALNRTDQ